MGISRGALVLTFLATTSAMLPVGARARPDADAGTPPQAIIVLGEGLPSTPGNPAYGSVTIGRDRIENTASNRIEALLREVAGFQQFRRSDSRSANPSAQGATLRALGGNASSRTLVLLDDVPVADPFFGFIPFNALVPDRLSSIRVTRGGGLGAFGAGAVAGTVELTSATRADLPMVGGSAFYGSSDSTELSASVSPDLGSGFVSLSGRWDRSDGFWTTPRSQRVPASVPASYENWSASVRAVAPLSEDFQLQARALVFRDDRTLRFAGADSHSEGQDASVRLIGGTAWKVDALAYVQARNFRNIVISATSFRKTLDQRNTPSTGVGGKIEVRPPSMGGHVIRIGADTRFASGDMHESPYSAVTGQPTAFRHARGRQNTTGIFVEDDWTLGQLVLTGGARADYWSIRRGFHTSVDLAGATTHLAHADRSDWQASFRAGAMLKLGDAVTLRGAGYTGFRLPTLNELYRPFVVFPITTKANAALRPERLKGVEGGIDLAPVEGISLSATAFYNRLDNAIANVTLDAITRERQNVDAIAAKGIELTASARLSDFALSASYTFTDSKVKASGQMFDGLRPAQTPRHAASATLGYAPEGGPALSAALSYIGAQYEDDLQTGVLPEALTVDAFASFPLGRGVSVVARGENLFDEDVVTRNSGGSIDLGTPRSFWIGIRVER